MKKLFSHLGIYSDLVEKAKSQTNLFPETKNGQQIQKDLKELLGFSQGDEYPQDIRIENTWINDGIEGETISWSVGYGPRTFAWLLHPEGKTSKLPGVLALHDHGGFKFYGKEKIAYGPETPNSTQLQWWKEAYGGRAYANELCKQGFVVLVHDTFLWGSRKFPIEDIPMQDRDRGRLVASRMSDYTEEINFYNASAGFHEHTVEKYCNLLGSTLAGIVSHEDRIALNYLSSREEVDHQKIGCIGLSGGGNRAALLLATNNTVNAAVIVGLMSTYFDLLDHNVISHTWMFFPHGWSRFGDWPDIAACRAPMPLLIQYDNDDELFTLEGMQNADRKITQIYNESPNPSAYTGQFFPGPHKFDVEMQESAFLWLKKQLNIGNG